VRRFKREKRTLAHLVRDIARITDIPFTVGEASPGGRRELLLQADKVRSPRPLPTPT